MELLLVIGDPRPVVLARSELFFKLQRDDECAREPKVVVVEDERE
jgi:hypothetical protein